MWGWGSQYSCLAFALGRFSNALNLKHVKRFFQSMEICGNETGLEFGHKVDLEGHLVVRAHNALCLFSSLRPALNIAPSSWWRVTSSGESHFLSFVVGYSGGVPGLKSLPLQRYSSRCFGPTWVRFVLAGPSSRNRRIARA